MYVSTPVRNARYFYPLAQYTVRTGHKFKECPKPLFRMVLILVLYRKLSWRNRSMGHFMLIILYPMGKYLQFFEKRSDQQSEKNTKNSYTRKYGILPKF